MLPKYCNWSLFTVCSIILILVSKDLFLFFLHWAFHYILKVKRALGNRSQAITFGFEQTFVRENKLNGLAILLNVLQKVILQLLLQNLSSNFKDDIFFIKGNQYYKLLCVASFLNRFRLLFFYFLFFSV